MKNFGKLNFSVAFQPTSAFPLDGRTVFSSYASALAAAKTAEEVGSTNTKYHIGMKLLVIENDVPTWYTITKDKTLAADIPNALPNPHALTFTGAATGTYDGSSPLTVNIPEGGDESNLLVVTIKSENEEYVSSHTFQEIKEQCDNGSHAVLCVEGTLVSFFPLVSISNTQAFFGKQAFSGQLFISQGYYIKADGSVTFDQQMIEIPEGGGGGFDWNDLTNRPFYDNEDGSVGKQLDDKYLKMLEQATNEVIPEQEMELTYNESLGVYQSGNFNLFTIALGETYEVVWGENTFTCTAFEGVLDGASCVAIGNPYPVGGANNDLPFIIGVIPLAEDQVMSLVVALEAITSVKVRVYQPLEGFKIKPEYLPLYHGEVESV